MGGETEVCEGPRRQGASGRGLRSGSHRAANSLQPAIAELERGYRAFKSLFPEGIPGHDPVIVIQQSHSFSRGSRSSSFVGALTPHAWENRKGQEVNEISIAAEQLARPTEEIFAALLHEMVHHCNALRGVSDGGDPRGYHNRAFHELAQAVGLIVIRDGRCGWALTSLGPKAESAVWRFKAREDAFEMFRKPAGPNKARTWMLKWSCGCTTLRCATELEADCRRCGNAFERV